MISLKTVNTCVFSALFFLSQGALYAQEDNAKKKSQDMHTMTPENINEVRPGMEIRKVGGINMVVPEGTQFYMEGSQLKMEEASEYSARRFKQVEERFKIIEEKEKKMEEKMQKLEEETQKVKEALKIRRK